jgi:chromosome partitioning protein
VTATVKELRQIIKEARTSFDLVIIDTPPYSGTEGAEACAFASFVLIPCRPSKFDLRAIASTCALPSLPACPLPWCSTKSPRVAPWAMKRRQI